MRSALWLLVVAETTVTGILHWLATSRAVSAAAALWETTQHPELVSGEPLSVAMAMQNLLLAAHALGLGTCVMTAPLLADNLAEALPVPPGFAITSLIAVGHPDGNSPPPRRKSLAQIVDFDRNSQPTGGPP